MEVGEPFKKVFKYWENLYKFKHPTNTNEMNVYNDTSQTLFFLSKRQFLLLLLEFLNRIL